jgi:hypothetical protein
MKRFEAMEEELCGQTARLLHHYLPIIETQLRDSTGETKAKISVEMLFDEDEDEGLHMMVTAKVTLPKQEGHQVKLQWNHGQLQLFGQELLENSGDLPDEALTDEERELERVAGEPVGGEDEGDTGPAEADVEL